jgi:aspartyl protease family protein
MIPKDFFFSLTLLALLFTLFSTLLDHEVSSNTVSKNHTVIINKSRSNSFYTQAVINGVKTKAIIDTGADDVAMSEKTANALGIDYSQGFIETHSTANGTVKGKLIRLDSVKIGDIELNHVRASVLQSDMDAVLIGMSFLGKLNMQMSQGKIILSEQL